MSMSLRLPLSFDSVSAPVLVHVCAENVAPGQIACMQARASCSIEYGINHHAAVLQDGVPHLFPFNLCLSPIPMGSMIRIPKILALQFVIVKPVVATISIVVYACGEFEKPFYQWTLFFVYNVSYSVALYALYLVYWASHDHQALQSKSPLLKFVSVKMIVFLTFWQALILPHLPLPGSMERWENLILVAEMVVFAVLMNAAFSWKEFQSGSQGVRLTSAIGGAPKPTDIGNNHSDLIGLGDSENGSAQKADGAKTGAAVTAQQAREVVRNAGAAFCPRDVLDDGIRNFSRRYQKHVLIESAQEYELHAGEQDATVAASTTVDLLGDLPEQDGSTCADANSNAAVALGSSASCAGSGGVVDNGADGGTGAATDADVSELQGQGEPAQSMAEERAEGLDEPCPRV